MSRDVAIIGGGPSGLAAATTLKRLGIEQVTLIEREAEAGGIPRHCGHPPFGMREFGRVLDGPRYARRLVERADKLGVDMRCSTSVVSLQPNGVLTLSDNQGQSDLKAERVVLATGVREGSRAARFIGGDRTRGIVSTGALQSLIYIEKMRPFKRPVIIGSELVSFSALLTCHHAGIKPRAIVEKNPRITARFFALGLPLIRGISVITHTEVVRICGNDQVTGVVVRDLNTGNEETIDADGVIVSGDFTPESTLARMGGLTLDPASGGAAVDQYGRTSDSRIFVAGNALRPVETAGWSWREGVRIGQLLAEDLLNEPADTPPECSITVHEPIRYVIPQRVRLPLSKKNFGDLQIRVCRPAKGKLFVKINGKTVWSRRLHSLPERRITIPIKIFSELSGGENIEIGLAE